MPIGNSEYDGSPQLWQMPQGGIDKDEDPLEAAYRELYEETGMKTVYALAEAKDWINYDLPPQLIWHRPPGKYRGQTSALVRLSASTATKAKSPSTRRQAATSRSSTPGNGSRWHELPGLIVAFKRSVYEQVVAEFQHLAGLESWKTSRTPAAFPAAGTKARIIRQNQPNRR